ncbi:MAG TPA: nickel-dependent lactate racemase [Blastocatellia bacterium]|nr:nickel-dependent lactate racemase [Blastocatellia bacterium]
MVKDEVDLSNGAGTCQVLLGYGRRRIPFHYDPEQFEILLPADAGRDPLTDAQLSELISAPIGSPPLEEIVGRNDRVVVVVPDATRAAGVNRVASQLFSRLLERGVAGDRISFLIGGGIHRPPFPEEIEQLLGAEIARLAPVHAHLADDPAESVTLGVTSRGTQVSLNRRLVETDHVVVVGGITFHYFAGFSGGRKAILPGCAAEPSIQHNHKLAFDEQTMDKRAGVASGLLEGNIVHEDMVEAVRTLNPSFLVNTVLNGDSEVVSAYAGDWYEAHLRGCAEYAAAHTARISARRSLVIVSAGGWPRDMNLIQSHKAMEHASAALTEGGVMIVLAECSQGLGRDDFLDWFATGGAHATALKLMENYKVNGQTAWGLRRKAERFRILLVSNLDAGIVRHMGLEPHTSLESALAAAPLQAGYVAPNGLTTLPRLETQT